MTRFRTANDREGTPLDLMWATELGARLAARRRLAAGEEGDTIRKETAAEFQQDLAADEYTVPMQVSLMAAVRRAIDEVLANGASANAVCAVNPWALLNRTRPVL